VVVSKKAGLDAFQLLVFALMASKGDEEAVVEHATFRWTSLQVRVGNLHRGVQHCWT
jgi:hypothetical protein